MALDMVAIGKAQTALSALFARPDTGPALKIAGATALALLAIRVLYQLAVVLRLGGDVRIADAEHARRIANEAVEGFDARDIALDRARIGALVRNAAGKVLLIRRHGARFVVRELTSHAGIRLDRQFLTLPTGDPRDRLVTLELGAEAQAWAASLRRLEERE